jgi:ribonuclease P protein component
MIPSSVSRLKKRSDFLRVAAGQQKTVMSTMVVQLGHQPLLNKQLAKENSSTVRVGFTASRKVGNAVKRNRARRRLKATIQAVFPVFDLARKDIVIIARSSTLTASFTKLSTDCHQALKQLGLKSL